MLKPSEITSIERDIKQKFADQNTQSTNTQSEATTSSASSNTTVSSVRTSQIVPTKKSSIELFLESITDPDDRKSV